MTKLMPLKRVVVELTQEAAPDDPRAIRRAIKSWHNRLSIGSIPRTVVTKLGRGLYLDLDEWEGWLKGRTKEGSPRPGRPRSE